MGRLTLLPSEVKSSPDALAGFSNIPFGPVLIIPFNHQDGIPDSLYSVIQELSHEVKVISFTVLRSLDLQVLQNLASHVLQLQSRLYRVCMSLQLSTSGLSITRRQMLPSCFLCQTEEVNNVLYKKMPMSWLMSAFYLPGSMIT